MIYAKMTRLAEMELSQFHHWLEGHSMHSLNSGRFQHQIKLLRQQFLQDGELPFANVLTSESISKVIELAELNWRERISTEDQITFNRNDSAKQDIGDVVLVQSEKMINSTTISGLRSLGFATNLKGFVREFLSDHNQHRLCSRAIRSAKRKLFLA